MTRCGFIPVSNAASVEMIYTLNGEIAENVFHVTKGSPYTFAQLQALRATVITWYTATWRNWIAGNAILSRVRTRSLDSVGAPFEDYTLPVPIAGLQPGTALPGNTTWCVKKATGLAGRSYRGRWYIVGVATTYYGTDADHVGAAPAANVVAALNTLIPVLTAAGHTLVVVSYRAGGLCRATGLTSTVTSFVAVDLNLDSMRRRLAGRGH